MLAMHQAGCVVGQVLEQLQRAIQAVPANVNFDSYDSLISVICQPRGAEHGKTDPACKALQTAQQLQAFTFIDAETCFYVCIGLKRSQSFYNLMTKHSGRVLIECSKVRVLSK